MDEIKNDTVDLLKCARGELSQLYWQVFIAIFGWVFFFILRNGAFHSGGKTQSARKTAKS